MTEPRKVWGVARGQYSDYGVLCLTETEAEADEIVERYNRMRAHHHDEEAFVQEFPLFRASEVGPQRRLRITGRDGQERYAMVWPWDDPAAECDVVETPGMPARFWVEGTDHPRVRKAYYDRSAQEKARAAGL